MLKTSAQKLFIVANLHYQPIKANYLKFLFSPTNAAPHVSLFRNLLPLYLKQAEETH